jgi:molybdate transport system substrate-binding protein
MKKFFSVFLAGVFMAIVFAGCSDSNSSESLKEETTAAQTSSSEKIELTVSAAASLTDVLKEIGAEYEKTADVKINFNFGASGSLQAQIEEGAPVDLFVSATQKQMKALENKGLIISETKKNLLSNEIVLITPAKSQKEISSFEDCASEKVGKMAFGDPKTTPIGQYAEEVFTKLGLADEISSKLVYGSDVRQVLSWVESGEVDCGLVFRTDALTSDKVKIICPAPEGYHEEISYPAAVIKSSKNQEAAKDFLAYLSGDEAKTIFEKYGFIVL